MPTDPLTGLSPEDAAERLARFGPNALAKARGRPLYRKILAQFTHLMALLLWVGGLIGFAAGMPQIGVAVWAVNLINGSFGFWQEHKAERAAEALQRILPRVARVRRGGQELPVDAGTLVPGDVLILTEGDNISADALVLESTELRVNQSTLTGESQPVEKTPGPVAAEGLSRFDRPDSVFAGTTVAAGNGLVLVSATGMSTELGKIAGITVELPDEKSPLQLEMERATRVVSVIAIGVGVLFFGLAVLAAGMRPVEGFLFALGMIVAFVPEGMLPTVTLSLALGVQRMARKKALVKRLSAVETLGCTSVICTDKTGTLTQNEMTVREIWRATGKLEVTGVGYDAEGAVLRDGAGLTAAQDADLADLLMAGALCNNARILPAGPPPEGKSKASALGDPTEAALLVLGAKGGADAQAAAARWPREREVPFDSRRSRMSTLHSDAGAWRLFVKGAPVEVLARCTRVRSGGEDLPLPAAERARVAQANDAMARSGLRVLALAVRTFPARPTDGDAELLEQDLTLLGLVGMMDPPRPKVADAVQSCHRAGIRIVMVTGDDGLTAESVAPSVPTYVRRRPPEV